MSPKDEIKAHEPRTTPAPQFPNQGDYTPTEIVMCDDPAMDMPEEGMH